MKANNNALPAFEARRPTSDLEYVYNELKQSFMIGEFVPGQRLTLPALAEAFGTSQMPVREAASRLVLARAIEALPRRSLRVPEATTERLDLLLPLRLQLEGEAVRLAVEAGCGKLARSLTAINGEMDDKAASDDRKAYLRLNQEFHFSIYQKCGNGDLIDLIELLWMRYGPLMNIVRSGELSVSGHVRHAEAIDAIGRGDAGAAAEAMRADIREAAQAIRPAIADARRREDKGAA
ncbi:GntR family transcriptional regulator [Aureimonas psammosilenae]|uniref:GntR family transcriptional regulator n=1 Tax=Aureimonas psammosilenae TaxID=2495496 RepID=UPI001F3BCE47|nr:GntR family transcriptional regulator [Aureimonas psammosilenae]